MLSSAGETPHIHIVASVLQLPLFLQACSSFLSFPAKFLLKGHRVALEYSVDDVEGLNGSDQDGSARIQTEF